MKAVPGIGVNRALRFVNRKRVVVDAEAVAVRVRIGEQSEVSHLFEK
jgi:hypothetical protein